MEKKTAREMIREKYGTIVLSEPIHETLMQEFSTQELTEYKTKLKAVWNNKKVIAVASGVPQLKIEVIDEMIKSIDSL